MYEVVIHRQALKAWERLPEPHRRRVAEALDALGQDPFAGGLDICKLRGEFAGLWRLRIGDTRVVYAVDTNQRRVFVEGISFRGGAYRK